MPPLYLMQQNTKIRIRNRRVQVEDESVELPISTISAAAATGGTQKTNTLQESSKADGNFCAFTVQSSNQRQFFERKRKPVSN